MRRGFCEEVVKELRAEEQVGVNQVQGIGRGVLGGECACGKPGWEKAGSAEDPEIRQRVPAEPASHPEQQM